MTQVGRDELRWRIRMLYVICYMRILWHAWRMEVGGYALTQILDDRRSYQLEYRFVLDPSLHEYHKSELPLSRNYPVSTPRIHPNATAAPMQPLSVNSSCRC